MYYSDKYFDLVVVKLKGPVIGLQEFSISDAFDPYNKSLTGELKDLIYVGYGKPYNGLDYLNTPNDGRRRSCRSRVFQYSEFVSKKFAPYMLMAQPYGARVYEVLDEKGQFKRYTCMPRDLFEDELPVQEDMSGGMAYQEKFGLIGINVMVHEIFMSSVNKWMIKNISFFDCVLGVGRMFCDIPHLKIHPHFYTGRVKLTIRLSEFKDWIKESKDKLLKNDFVSIEQDATMIPNKKHNFWKCILKNIRQGDILTMSVVGYVCFSVVRDIYHLLY